jgi:hypothetical protein
MRRTIHKINDLDIELALWASFNWPEKITEMLAMSDDDHFQLRSLGEIVKRRATDPSWFFWAARNRAAGLLELSSYIGEVVCYDHVFPTPGYGWRKWLEEIGRM